MEPNPVESRQAGNKTMRAAITGAVLAALLAGGGVYAYEKSQNNASQAKLQNQVDSLKLQVATKPTITPSPLAAITSSAVSTWKTYRDTQFKFTFSYPPNYTVQPVTDGNGANTGNYILRKNGETAGSDKNTIEISLDPVAQSAIPPQNNGYMETEAENTCIAAGVTGSIQCPSVKQETQFENSSSTLLGQAILLNEETTTNKPNGTQTKVSSIVGPIYVYDISHSVAGHGNLLVYPALGEKPDQDTVQEVAKSITF